MNTSLYGGLIEISPDGQPITPDLVLSYRGGTKQGIIRNVQSLTNANALVETAEISFDVYKEIDGVKCQLWDDIRDFRLVYIPHLDTSTFNPWYELSVEVDENDCTIKHCQGVHLQEAELSQLTLNGVEINTEDDIARDDYSPTIIYDPKNPEASALDRILKDKASHYTIVHVDSSIANLQRTFSWDGSSIKDAFDDIANEVECLFKYGEYTNNDGKIHRTISVYDLNDRCMECGERGSFTTKVCPKCGSSNINYGYGTDSGIFLSHENFAGDITYSSNKDSVKNCFRLVAGDDLMTATIRNITPSGSQYIWYLSDSVRADMSQALQNKLKSYDTEYESYSTEKQIDIPSTVISEYNALINKYKLYDDTLTNVKYPIIGYSALIDVYYSALNFYSLLKTTLAPASEHGEKTTAAKELTKLTTNTLSPLGIQNAEISSSATVTSAVQNYAKVFIDTSLYRITAKCNTYEAKVWKGTITLTGYSDDEDTATSAELTVYVSDATPDFIKCQIEKAMKKNNVDATGTVALFKKSESEFKQALSFYSVDNLNILASIARGCLDILIQQGVADPENELYSSMYLPYYNKSVWIQDELREREAEVLKLRGTRSNPDGVLDYIEKQRQAIANKLDLRSYLGETLWVEFCSFRRDDTYQNDNFISDGLSDTELIAQAKEFVKNAEREIVKSATLQHTISCNLNNFLLVKEQDVEESPVPIVTLDGIRIITHDQLYLVKGNATFSPLLADFEVGNWVHIEIDGVVYKLRLTSYKIDYDNLDKLDVEFSDVTYGLDYMSDTQSILAQAQSMATSYSMVQHQANKGNNANKQIMDMVKNGLNLTNKKIVNTADNQNIVVDESGVLIREKNEFGDDYSPEQTKIINFGVYITDDNWKTSKTGIGKFQYFDPKEKTYKKGYGVIADTLIGNLILSSEVGIYNQEKSIEISEDGIVITTTSNTENSKNVFTIRKENSDIYGNTSYERKLYIDDDGNIVIYGKLFSHEGIIAGWTITNDALYRGSSEFNIANSSDNYNAYFGKDGLSISNKFSVDNTGKLSASDANIIGNITAETITANQSYSIYYDDKNIKIIHYDGGSLKLGLLKDADTYEGAGFELLGDNSINVYGHMYTQGYDIDVQNLNVNNNITAYGAMQCSGLIKTLSEYQSQKNDRTWVFGSATGAGDQDWFGFYDDKYGFHGGWYAPNHTFRAYGEVQAGVSTANAFRAVFGNYGFIIRNDGAGLYMMPTNSGDPYGSWNNNYSYIDLSSGQWLLKDNKGHREAPILSSVTDSYRVVRAQVSGNNFRFDDGNGTARYCAGSASDIRLKTNVNDTEVSNALCVVNSMKVRSFDWKESGKHQKIGFVADELEILDPNLTYGGGYTEDGGMNTKIVDTFYMLGYVVKAIQEMYDEIKLLKQ